MTTETVAIVNQKGGTGKTTTVVNLGAALARKRKKVLLVDMDPQANLTYSLGIKPDATIVETLKEEIPLQEALVKKEKMWILPGSLDLVNLEVSITNRPGRENFLKHALAGAPGFDFILIDGPPTLSVLTLNALLAADSVLIPMQMEVLTLQGVTQLLDTVRQVNEVFGKNIKVQGILATRFDPRRRLSQEVLEHLSRTSSVSIFKTYIRDNVRIAEAPSHAKSVLEYAPASSGSADYMAFAAEFLALRKSGDSNGHR